MSLTTVKGYFRTHCKALGYKEHIDALNWHNVAEAGANKVFHLEFGETSGQRQLMPSALESNTRLSVRLFFKAGRDTGTGVDLAIAESENLIKRCLKVSNRLGATIKNVAFNSMTVEPLDASNDNQIISTIHFTASVLTDVE
jgi:hypothetical protein